MGEHQEGSAAQRDEWMRKRGRIAARRAAIVAVSALGEAVRGGWPVSIMFTFEDLEAVEAFIIARLSATNNLGEEETT